MQFQVRDEASADEDLKALLQTQCEAGMLNHLQYRSKAEGGVTRLMFLHRAMGSILPEYRDGLPKGWQHWLERIRERAEKKK